MTRLLTLMGRYEITVYKICKILGLGIGSHTRVKKMINGTATIDLERLEKLKNHFKHICDDEIDFDVVRIKL